MSISPFGTCCCAARLEISRHGFCSRARPRPRAHLLHVRDEVIQFIARECPVVGAGATMSGWGESGEGESGTVVALGTHAKTKFFARASVIKVLVAALSVQCGP